MLVPTLLINIYNIASALSCVGDGIRCTACVAAKIANANRAVINKITVALVHTTIVIPLGEVHNLVGFT